MDILAFFAHPDDETMLSGGVLALLARTGARVHYLCATRGEGGELGEPPVCDRPSLGRVREGEMSCAVQVLGGSSLAFLNYVDPLVGPEDTLYPYSDDVQVLTAELLENIRRIGPAAVITHGAHGEYGHPAHVLTHQAARMAVEECGETGPGLYTVQANFPDHPKPRLANPDEEAHLIVDVTPALEEKVGAALCHRSQHALFVRRASEEAGRLVSVPEVIVNLESLRRVLPPLENGPAVEADTLFQTLWPYRWRQPEGI